METKGVFWSSGVRDEETIFGHALLLDELLLDGYTLTLALTQRVGPSAWINDAGQGRLLKEFLIFFVTGAAPVHILFFILELARR
jgi:hypothetical protein